MYDEHGYQYTPHDTLDRPKAETSPQPPPPTITRASRPVWAGLGANAVLFLAMVRFCSPLNTDSTSLILIQLLSGGILMIVALGLMTLRRWAAYLFILICVWSIVSAIMVTGVRMANLDQLDSIGQRDLVALTLLRDAILSVVIYSALGLLYAFNLKHFQSAGPNRYGNIPFVLMFGVMVLFTAVQIADAPSNIAFRAETLDDAQTRTDNLFGN